MADYKTAYLLSLIGGILILINGILAALLGGLISTLDVSGLVAAAGIVVAILGIVFGILVIYGATLFKKKKKEQIGAVLVLVFSILSLLIGGGFFIGFILALIGAIMGLTKK